MLSLSELKWTCCRLALACQPASRLQDCQLLRDRRHVVARFITVTYIQARCRVRRPSGRSGTSHGGGLLPIGILIDMGHVDNSLACTWNRLSWKSTGPRGRILAIMP